MSAHRTLGPHKKNRLLLISCWQCRTDSNLLRQRAGRSHC